MSAKKILMFTTSFPPDIGGIASLLASRVESDHENNIKALVGRLPNWGRNRYKQIKIGNIEVQNFPFVVGSKPLVRTKQLLVPAIFLLKRLMKLEHFDLIETAPVLPLGYIAAFFKPFFKYKIVLHILGNEFLRADNNRLSRPLYRYAVKKSDIVVTISSFANELFKKQELKKETIVINPPIRNFIWKASAKSYADTASCRERIILSAGRLVPGRKRFDLPIHALPSLVTKYPGIRYRVIGDGPLKVRLLNLAKDLSVSDHFEILDGVPDEELPQHYASADLFVLYSEYLKNKEDLEAYGIVYAEAASFGKPIIAAADSGAVDIVEHGASGFLMTRPDVSELCHLIDKLLSNDELRSRMGKIARQTVISKRGYEKLIRAIELM